MKDERDIKDSFPDDGALKWDDQRITYHCKYCEGIDKSSVLEDSKKVTDVAMELCPFCGKQIQPANKSEPGE